MEKRKGKYERTEPKAPAASDNISRGRRQPSPKVSRKANPWITVVYLWLALALPELALHIATASSRELSLNVGLLLPLLFALVPALILAALYLLIPLPRVHFWVTVAYSLLSLILCGSQLVYHHIFGTFYSAYSLVHGAKVVQFWRIALSAIGQCLPILLLMALPLLFLCTPARRKLCFRAADNRLFCLFLAVMAIAVQAVTVVILPLFGTGSTSAHRLYHSDADSYLSTNRLGAFTALRLDMTRLASGKSSAGGTIQLSTQPSGEAVSTSEPRESGGEDEPSETSQPTQPPISGDNVLDIDFDTLIAQASSDDVREVHQYFSSRAPSAKNEKTGMFEGCNLILICAEAFSGLTIDEERTPMLYQMYHEGFQFTNYYVPDWGTSTTDGEYAFLTGTIPESNVWSFYRSSENAMPLTMCQQLQSLGYNAYAYHGHTYDYYNRNLYLENLGYTYRALDYGLDIDDTWPESDLEMVRESTADFVSSEPFTVYYMTISGHREFTFSGNYISYKNEFLVADEPYSSNVRAYLACQLELEKALELLVKRLDAAGTLENTVFVLTADHYPNGLTNEELGELLGHEVETNFEIFKNTCIFYKPGMTPEVIDAPCSHLDLLPTLSNLFGLEFDSRLYMGRDVFSDAEPLVLFRNRSWITDLASYNAATGTLTNLTDTPVSEDYVNRIRAEVDNRFTVSNRILDYDYWRILFG